MRGARAAARTASRCGGRRSAATSARVGLRPRQARRVPRSSGGWPPPPTCWSRTSARARWSAGASAPTCCTSSTPAWSLVRITGFGQTGPVRRPPGLRHPGRGDERLRRTSPARPTVRRRCRRSAWPTASAASPRPRRPDGALPPRPQRRRGQVVDLSLLEPIMAAVGPAPTIYEQLGMSRRGTATGPPTTHPATPTATRDGQWVAVSTSAQRDRRAGAGAGRSPRGDRRAVVRHRPRPGRARRPARRLRRRLDRRSATARRGAGRLRGGRRRGAPVYDAADLVEDPHVRADRRC